MTLGLLLALGPVHAQQPLGGGDVIVEITPGLTGEILLDGHPTGTTAPGVLAGVPPGEHRIQVRGDCLMGMNFVTVVPGQLNRVTVDLQTTGGFVEVSVVPPTAEIVIDDEPAGQGPSVGTELACGEHQVLVRHPEHGHQLRTVRVAMGTAQTVFVDLTLPPPPPPAPPAPPPQDLTGLRRGIGLGLAVLGVGGLGAGAYIHRTAWQDYEGYYVPAFESCEDLACQEDLQTYREDTIARRYYGGMLVAGIGFVSLTTAGIVGLTSDGYPVWGFTRRW